MKNSNIEERIASLEKDIIELKTSQVLAGTNTKVYSKYVECESLPVIQQTNGWYAFSLGPGSWTMINRLILAADKDDPFEILRINKMEIWRSGKKLSGWSPLTEFSRKGVGQASSLGDVVHIGIKQQGYTSYQTGTPTGGLYRLAPMIMIYLHTGPAGYLYDNPAIPFTYTIKLWLTTTNDSNYSLIRSG